MAAADEFTDPAVGDVQWQGFAVVHHGITIFSKKRPAHVRVTHDSTIVVDEIDDTGQPVRAIVNCPLSRIRKITGAASWVTVHSGYERYRLQFTNTPYSAGSSIDPASRVIDETTQYRQNNVSTLIDLLKDAGALNWHLRPMMILVVMVGSILALFLIILFYAFVIA